MLQVFGVYVDSGVTTRDHSNLPLMHFESSQSTKMGVAVFQEHLIYKQ